MTNNAERLIFEYSINDLPVRAVFYAQDVEQVFIPLMKSLTVLQKQLERTIIVYLAAPPGCGKSTLATFLQEESHKRDDVTDIQAIGIDGYHYSQKQLKPMTITVNGEVYPLSLFKGVPASFDVTALKEDLQRIKNGEDVWWRLYSRKTHDPILHAIHLQEKIILLEGNYLLYTEENWSDLYSFCDFSIYMTNHLETLKKRLISRKIAGGASEEEAIHHYEMTDGVNIQRVTEHHRQADVEMLFNEDNKIEFYHADRILI